jgi:hypothetical protein
MHVILSAPLTKKCQLKVSSMLVMLHEVKHLRSILVPKYQVHI